MIGTDGSPVRLEMEALVGMAEAVEEMRGGERQSQVMAALCTDRFGVRQARSGERAIDDFPLRHSESRMLGSQSLGQLADDIVIGSRSPAGLDHLPRHLEEGMAAGGVDVVMLEHRS